MRFVLATVLAFGIFAAACLDCPAGDPVKNSRETARFVTAGTARGLTTPALIAAQHQKALANWKRLYTADTPPHFESPHFLLYGKVAGKDLKDIAPALEKQHELAVNTLEMESEEPWPGKLAVFFLTERREFNSFVRVVEKRKADDDETACFDIDAPEPHIFVGPTEGKSDLNAAGQAGEQMAEALLTKKTRGAVVPPWLLSAFGRATVFRAAGFKDLAFEHRRAQVLALQKIKTLKLVFGTGVPAEDAAILRASVIEYLAYSGKSAKFFPLLQGFRPSENMPEPTFDAALASANLSVDRLDQVWQAWLKTLK